MENKLKIGIVCYPTYGGSGVVATELGIALSEQGHEVHFISYDQPFRLDLFSENQYFLNDELTVIDCVLAPILWRLEYFGISLGKEHKAITDYMERVFSRETFQNSLSEDEEEMHL